MNISRRKFLGWLGAAGLGSAAGKPTLAAGNRHFEGYPESFGILHDIGLCVGCRNCEAACSTVNELPVPGKPFTDLSVLNEKRRTTATAYTVVNKYEVPGKKLPIFRKNQCNHCVEPACASACFVQATLPRGFFDFEPMLTANRDGYFPYTPPLTLIRGLRASVDMLLEEGLENVFRRHRHFADAVRAAVAAWNLRLCAKQPAFHSDTVSAILVPEGTDAAAVVRLAYERYDLSLGVGLAQLAGKAFRIGHLGDLNALMVLASIAGAEMAMRDAGIGVDVGSGVAAAQALLRTGFRRASDRSRAAA